MKEESPLLFIILCLAIVPGKGQSYQFIVERSPKVANTMFERKNLREREWGGGRDNRSVPFVPPEKLFASFFVRHSRFLYSF